MKTKPVAVGNRELRCLTLTEIESTVKCFYLKSVEFYPRAFACPLMFIFSSDFLSFLFKFYTSYLTLVLFCLFHFIMSPSPTNIYILNTHLGKDSFFLHITRKSDKKQRQTAKKNSREPNLYKFLLYFSSIFHFFIQNFFLFPFCVASFCPYIFSYFLGLTFVCVVFFVGATKYPVSTVKFKWKSVTHTCVRFCYWRREDLMVLNFNLIFISFRSLL